MLATRASEAMGDAVTRITDGAVHDPVSRMMTVDTRDRADPLRLVAVVSAETKDIPVAAEAAGSMGRRFEVRPPAPASRSPERPGG